MAGLYVYSNVTAFGAQNVLSGNMSNLTGTLARLSTGLRINSGKDDPAGLVASEVLKSDIVATNEAITNTQRANSVMGVADSALSQINVLLNDIRGLVNESANTGAISAAEIAANQLQIDASLDSIDRIARNTNFQGKKVLDGSLDFATVGVDSKAISNLQIHSANFGRDETRDVTVNLFKSAEKAALVYYGTGVGNDTVVRIGGSEGSELFKFGAGTTTSEMAAAINALSDSTGIVAHIEGIAARGSITLSSTGTNNDIVITASDVGFDVGNYTFRIIKGSINDARIVSKPVGATPGVVEISLQAGWEQTFNNFAGLFNITTNARYNGGTSNMPASVNLTRGNDNLVQFLTTPQNATGTSQNGAVTISANVNGSGTNNQHTSELNGWTIIVDNANGNVDGTIDGAAKTITFTDASVIANINAALSIALGDSTGGSTIVVTSSITGTLANGDRVMLKGGGDAGELLIQYKAGTTVGEIQDLINNTTNVQAALANGANRSDIIANLPSGSTYMLNDGNKAAESQYTSSAAAQTVIDLINNGQLGSKFTAKALQGDTTGGRVTFQEASAIYGDVNSDNALRFTGMDSGAVIRLVSQDANGIGIANQQLGVKVVPPSGADIANGISTSILQISLATDAGGNSITTARDIAALFDRLTAAETFGINAELLLPSGVVPNTTNANFSNGIVNANSISGTELLKNYVVLLGNNQEIVDDYAYVDFGSSAPPFMTISAKVAGTEMAGVKVYLSNDTNMPAWTDGNLATANGSVAVTYDAGAKSLVVRANMGGVSGLNAYTLADVLNLDSAFSSSFSATTPYGNATDALNASALIVFDSTPTQPSGTTSGGYRIKPTDGQPTSSGIVMTGQSDSNEHLILESAEYGRDKFVNVSTVEGFFNTYSTLGERLDRLAGKDAVATINGQRAAARGNDISTSQFSFEGSMNVSGMSAGQKTSFTITGGGAVFQLGPDVTPTQQTRLGIQSVDTGSLGGTSGHLYQLKSGGNADMRTNTSLADRIVQEATTSIAVIRGRIGAIQRSTLDPNIQALQDNLEALVAAEADISNADFAEESSNLVRYQILVQSAASVLGQSNQLPQYAAMLVM